jgi:hypothetical protein
MYKSKVCEECKAEYTPKDHSGSFAWSVRKFCGHGCSQRAKKRTQFRRTWTPEGEFRAKKSKP